MHPVSRTLLLPAFLLAACGEAVSPTSLNSSSVGREGLASGAVLTHVEFPGFNDYDIPLSCLNGETTHWEGTITVILDIISTPSGLTQERIHVAFGSDYFVERANGVRYYPIGPFPVNEHHLSGPVTVIAGTAAGAWKSADGDVLALGFHAQFVYDKDGNPVLEKFIGACP
jgi:hypothetical protein